MTHDYSKGKVYWIKNKRNNKIYIGSTIQEINERWGQHKKSEKCVKLRNAMDEIGIDEFYIELIEKYPCSSRKELCDREGYYIRKYNTIEEGYNMYLTGRTEEERKEYKKENDKQYRERMGQVLLDKKKEYYQQNKERCKENSKRSVEARKEEVKEYQKNYGESNKDKLNEYHKKYYENNKEEFLKKCKEYREKNKERKRETDKAYQERNKERIREQKRAYYEANKHKWQK